MTRELVCPHCKQWRLGITMGIAVLGMVLTYLLGLYSA